MANPVQIHEFGNQLAVLMDDGTRKLAYPTHTNVWIISNPTSGGGDVLFYWPFDPSTFNINNGHPEDAFRTAGRPTHNGIDMGYGIANIEGTPIKAMADGVVNDIRLNIDGYGYHVGIHHIGDSFESTYSHMYTTPIVTLGQSVVAGQELGGIGTTGSSTGEHLHFQVYDLNIGDWIDPIAFMATWNPTGAVVG